MDLKYDLQMFAENENSENANKGDDNQSKEVDSKEQKKEIRYTKEDVEKLNFSESPFQYRGFTL